ncbi:FKBP-type peptidyl-prolyl cis-trans isomerase [uncultured Bacteroides sp.]|uniref:FKBP-type peptidyl-prolyl cis-trans isomerase n=1 Tax=uncultured Bacteroides sp. TaxID=162156 RepID=UPI0026192DBC|nr:FKBP-type peptidyl-prolyl cis-trans isomerase [uncultured Bacteroides sp.]
MKKNILWLLGVCATLSLCFSSCSKDTESVDPYSNWDTRNVTYIDSIAAVCKNAPAGEDWSSHLNYKLQDGNAIGSLGTQWAISDYVYMKRLPYNPDGVEPELGSYPRSNNDTVMVYYRGRLINGTVFDQNYTGTWNPKIAEPTAFTLSGVITGLETALWYMREGERAELYIPSDLGYGASSMSDIPANSTLIFDVRVEKIVHATGPDDRMKEVLE